MTIDNTNVDMSLAVPITNSLTFIFSLLTGLCLGEKIGGKGKWSSIHVTDMDDQLKPP